MFVNPFMHNVDKWSNILCLHHKISKVCLVIFQHNACKSKSVFKIISITSFVFLLIFHGKNQQKKHSMSTGFTNPALHTTKPPS